MLKIKKLHYFTLITLFFSANQLLAQWAVSPALSTAGFIIQSNLANANRKVGIGFSTTALPLPTSITAKLDVKGGLRVSTLPGLEIFNTLKVSSIPPNSYLGTDPLGNFTAIPMSLGDKLGSHTALIIQ